jgi:acyl dehydratase
VTRARGPAPLNVALTGKDLGSSVTIVTPEAIEAYARATNDLNPRYLAGEAAVASPIWPVVPAFASFMDAARDPELGVDLRRLLHAAEEHVLSAPIRAGDTLTVASVLESVSDGTFTIVATETNQEGVVVAEVRGTMLIRGLASTRTAAPPCSNDVVFEQRARVDNDQPRRYAEASGDCNPIHLDHAAARRSGLRGVILHGMCTMALATKAAVDGPAGGDPTRVHRVAVSFARPVWPGQWLKTRLWRVGGRGDCVAFGLETTDEGGAQVIAPAEVEVG